MIAKIGKYYTLHIENFARSNVISQLFSDVLDLKTIFVYPVNTLVCTIMYSLRISAHKQTHNCSSFRLRHKDLFISLCFKAVEYIPFVQQPLYWCQETVGYEKKHPCKFHYAIMST